jgi:hypothetical protein
MPRKREIDVENAVLICCRFSETHNRQNSLHAIPNLVLEGDKGL